MKRKPLLNVLWICVAAACSQSHVMRQVSPCTARPGDIYGSTADSMLGGIPVARANGIVDTERMIEPSPFVRTYNHLHALRYELRRFRSRHGQLPNDVEEFSPSSAPGIKINIDGWGSSIRYTRTGIDSYEFRAPGPDHALCTPDDMVAQNDTLPAPSTQD